MGEGNLLLDLLGEGPFAAFVLALVAVLGAFSRGLWDWVKGRHDRERSAAKDRRDAITELKVEVREAQSSADDERAARLVSQRRYGIAWEYAQQLRQHCICNHGTRPDQLPPWPQID